MRELRHDFRAFYHVSYDEVPTDEACDLIETLPEGSLFLSELDPTKAWTLSEKRLADIQDAVKALTQMLSDKKTTKDAPRVERPWDRYVKALMERVMEAKRLKSSKVRKRLEETEWVDLEVTDDGGDRPS